MADSHDIATTSAKGDREVPDEVISREQADETSGTLGLPEFVAGEATAALGGPGTGPASESEPSQANQSSSGGTSDGQSEEKRRKTPAHLARTGAGTSRAAGNQPVPQTAGLQTFFDPRKRQEAISTSSSSKQARPNYAPEGARRTETLPSDKARQLITLAKQRNQGENAPASRKASIVTQTKRSGHTAKPVTSRAAKPTATLPQASEPVVRPPSPMIDRGQEAIWDEVNELQEQLEDSYTALYSADTPIVRQAFEVLIPQLEAQLRVLLEKKAPAVTPAEIPAKPLPSGAETSDSESVTSDQLVDYSEVDEDYGVGLEGQGPPYPNPGSNPFREPGPTRTLTGMGAVLAQHLQGGGRVFTPRHSLPTTRSIAVPRGLTDIMDFSRVYVDQYPLDETIEQGWYEGNEVGENDPMPSVVPIDDRALYTQAWRVEILLRDYVISSRTLHSQGASIATSGLVDAIPAVCLLASRCRQARFAIAAGARPDTAHWWIAGGLDHLHPWANQSLTLRLPLPVPPVQTPRTIRTSLPGTEPSPLATNQLTTGRDDNSSPARQQRVNDVVGLTAQASPVTEQPVTIPATGIALAPHSVPGSIPFISVTAGQRQPRLTDLSEDQILRFENDMRNWQGVHLDRKGLIEPYIREYLNETLRGPEYQEMYTGADCWASWTTARFCNVLRSLTQHKEVASAYERLKDWIQKNPPLLKPDRPEMDYKWEGEFKKALMMIGIRTTETSADNEDVFPPYQRLGIFTYILGVLAGKESTSPSVDTDVAAIYSQQANSTPKWERQMTSFEDFFKHLRGLLTKGRRIYDLAKTLSTEKALAISRLSKSSTAFKGQSSPAKQPQSADKAPTASTSSTAKEPRVFNPEDLCQGCGHAHRGKCFKASHPDLNKEKCAFVESTVGKAYGLLKRSHLHDKWQLNAAKNGWEETPKSYQEAQNKFKATKRSGDASSGTFIKQPLQGEPLCCHIVGEPAPELAGVTDCRGCFLRESSISCASHPTRLSRDSTLHVCATSRAEPEQRADLIDVLFFVRPDKEAEGTVTSEQALLDTGAFGGSYISSRVADRLVAELGIITLDRRMVVCSCFGECRTLTKAIQVNTTLCQTNGNREVVRDV